MMMTLETLQQLEVVKAIIEIPANSNYKYEVDKLSGRLILDRPLSLFVPYSYGYIDNTLAEDKDPADIFILSKYPIQPLAEVKVKLVGGFLCNDKGIADDKLVGLLEGEHPSHFDSAFREIEYYLRNYKKEFEVREVFQRSDFAYELYNKNKC